MSADDAAQLARRRALPGPPCVGWPESAPPPGTKLAALPPPADAEPVTDPRIRLCFDGDEVAEVEVGLDIASRTSSTAG